MPSLVVYYMPRVAIVHSSMLTRKTAVHRSPRWSGSAQLFRRRIDAVGPTGTEPPASATAPPVSINTTSSAAREPDFSPEPRPPLRMAAGLASIGALESTYLAVQKLTGGVVACPVSGCQTALTSAYSTLFGLPLSLYGAVSYGGAAALAWWAAGLAASGEGKNDDDDDNVAAYSRAKFLYFLTSTCLAGVSSYLLYVLVVPLGGAECVYCLTSAALSFALFSIGLSSVGAKEMGKVAPPAVALFVITVLSLSLVLGSGDTDEITSLAYKPRPIETTSSQYSRALAAHLKTMGAKMYGAFWCSHCIEQKEVFGNGADIPYVECFPDGWTKGQTMASACAAADVKGFPTWVIGDKRFEGDQTLDALAKASDFRPELDMTALAVEFAVKAT